MTDHEWSYCLSCNEYRWFDVVEEIIERGRVKRECACPECGESFRSSTPINNPFGEDPVV